MIEAQGDKLTADLIAYLDGGADAATVARLDAAMRADGSLRRQFATLCVEAREIAELLGKATGAEAMSDEPAIPLRDVLVAQPARGPFVGFAWAAAAAVLILGIAGWLYLIVGGAEPIAPDRGGESGGAVTGIVIDAGEAQWTSDPIYDGGEVRSARRLALASGTVSVDMFGGAEVTLTGPVALSVIDATSCFLERGRIDVDLGDGGGTFRVVTPRFTAVDLGTRFSVEYDEAAESLVRVSQGAVELRLRADAGQAESEPIRVAAGTTVSIPPDARRLADVSITRRVDLAYVVGGTDGLTRPSTPAAIDTHTGRATLRSIAAVDGRWAKLVAAESPLVDSIFVIGARQDAVVVSQSGVSVTGLPQVTRGAWEHVRFGKPHEYASTVHGGTDYMGPGHSMLGLHANRGVTFDLTAIREAGAGLALRRFTAVCGMAANSAKGQADLFVAVDGVIVYERRGVRAADPVDPIDLPLDPDAKLLTLIATESNGSIDSDWSFFGDPIVELAGPAAEDHPALTPNESKSNPPAR